MLDELEKYKSLFDKLYLCVKFITILLFLYFFYDMNEIKKEVI